MSVADRYREQAELARASAEKAPTVELRKQWLDIARQYELLAEERDKSSHRDRP